MRELRAAKTAHCIFGNERHTRHGLRNVCSSCRKTALEALERRKKTEAEGSTTSESGHKIDSKTKVHDAIGKREKSQQIEEEYHKERDLEEKITEVIVEKKQVTEQKEKKHRKDFLDKRRTKPAEKPSAASDKHAAEITHTAQQNEAVALAKHGAHEERKKTEHDFSIPYQGQQMGGQIRFSGPIFNQFRAWLGNSAPIVNNVNVTMKETAPKQAGAITQSSDKLQDTIAAAEKGEAKKDAIKKDPVIDFIEENLRPGKKR